VLGARGRRLVPLLLAGGVTASLVGLFAVGGASGRSSGAGLVRAGRQTFRVNVDGGATKSQNEDFLAYFPSVVRVHPGDTIVFQMVGNGEPHTVTLGTLANNAVAAFDKLTPAQKNANTPPASLLRADAKVPQLLPHGPGDAVQSTANPCFVSTGEPPKGGCPKAAQPAFDGTQSFYNSGWLNSKQKFTVHISSSTRPGTYRYMCALHREGMTARIVVVPASTPVASPAAQFAAGQRVLAGLERKLAPALKAERHGKAPVPVSIPGAPYVLAGSGSPSVNEGGIAEFGPKVVTIPVGGSVTWWLLGVHTITFNSNKTDDDIRLTAPNGTVHLNPKAVAPAGGPGEPPPARGGPKSGIHFKLVTSATWNGRGFHNSGIFANSNPPLVEGYKLTFTRAGTYDYICTVHDNMKGTIVVH
jgi:plastocyanin